MRRIMARVGAEVGRREALGHLMGAGVGVAATGLLPAAAVAAAPNPFAFGDDYTLNWAVHAAHPTATITAIPNGVRLETGTVGANEQGIAIWSRATRGSTWTAKFRFRRLDSVNAPAQLNFVLAYFNVLGLPPKPANMTEWPGDTVAYSHAYGESVKGARIAFARAQAGDPQAARQISAAYFNAGKTTTLAPSSAAFDFPTGVICAVTITRKGKKITFTSKPAGGKKVSKSFTHSGFTTAAASGHFGFLCAPGRACEISSLTIS